MAPLLRCTDIIPADANGRATPACDTITLDETARHRRRLLLRSDHGIEFLLELAHVTLLRTGDRLSLDDGRQISVVAADEPLYEIHARDPLHLLRLAWHLGNRHLAAEIHTDHLRIRADTVIRGMVEQLGGRVVCRSASFDPEGGAYAGQPPHGHGAPLVHTQGPSPGEGRGENPGQSDGRRHGKNTATNDAMNDATTDGS